MIERHFSSFYFKNVHSSDIVNADTDIIKYNSQYISLTLIYNFLELRFGWDRATQTGHYLCDTILLCTSAAKI